MFRSLSSHNVFATTCTSRENLKFVLGCRIRDDSLHFVALRLTDRYEVKVSEEQLKRMVLDKEVHSVDQFVPSLSQAFSLFCASPPVLTKRDDGMDLVVFPGCPVFRLSQGDDENVTFNFLVEVTGQLQKERQILDLKKSEDRMSARVASAPVLRPAKRKGAYSLSNPNVPASKRRAPRGAKVQ